MPITRYLPGPTGNFHHVSAIPDMSPEELQQRVVWVGPNNFRCMFDLVTGDIFSTDCIWCDHRRKFRIPERVRVLFDGMHGKRLSELSANGRLETIQQFIRDNKDEVRPVQVGDISRHTTFLDFHEPTWQANSFPTNPEDMKFLPVGTKVKIVLPEKTVIHQITRAWAVNGGESTTYEINLDVRSGPLQHMGEFFTDTRQFVTIMSDDLLPSDEHGLVQTRTIPHNWWRDADWALFTMAAGVVMNLGIRTPTMPSLLGSLPFLAVEMTKRSLWVNWLVALGFQLNSLTGLTITGLDNDYRIAGGTAGLVAAGGQYLHTGLRFGYYRMGGMGYLSLPVVAAVAVAVVNLPDLWDAGWGLVSGSVSVSNGEMNFRPTNSALANEALSTFGQAVGTVAGNLQGAVNATYHAGRDGITTVLEDLKDLGGATIETGQEWAEGLGEIPGTFGQSFVKAAVPEEMRTSAVNWMRGGTGTILIVAAAVVGISIWDKTH